MEGRERWKERENGRKGKTEVQTNAIKEIKKNANNNSMYRNKYNIY